MNIFLIIFLVTVLVSWVFTKLWIPVVKRLNIVDEPDETRRLHREPKPLLGGIPLWFCFALVVIAVLNFSSALSINFKIPLSSLWYIGASCLIILVGGFFDDKFRLPWYITILFPLAAVLLAMIGGVNINQITNPLGGVLSLDRTAWHIGAHTLWWPADLITFLWLLGMSYTTKILDGLDGLATGMTMIGAVAIAFLALLTKFYQPDIALIALIFAGACLGFLFFNFHPAKIFLGEGGSLVIGFVLGILAILSGSKIMTTILVLAVPVLDVAWTIVRRLLAKQPIMHADRLHIHHRLVDAGFSERGTVLFLYSVGLVFGIAGIFLPGMQKVILLSFIGFFVILLLLLVHYAVHYETISKDKKH